MKHLLFSHGRQNVPSRTILLLVVVAATNLNPPMARSLPLSVLPHTEILTTIAPLPLELPPLEPATEYLPEVSEESLVEIPVQFRATASDRILPLAFPIADGLWWGNSEQITDYSTGKAFVDVSYKG